jgi:hypothetical protein
MKKFYFTLSIFFTFLAQAQISSLSNVCAGNPFNLTLKNQELIGNQSATGFTITFYTTQANAVAGTNAIATPTAYVPLNGVQQMIFARVFNIATNSFTIKSFALVNATPLVATVNQSTGAAISLSASGGTPPYLYSVNNLNYSGIAVFNQLPSGNYTGYVKDVNGCIATTSNFVIDTGVDAVNDTFAVTTTSTTIGITPSI